jgi:hypothetical protein
VRYDGRLRYCEITAEAATIWKQGATARLPDPAWNQLWRNQMLLEAMIRQTEPPGDEARLVVVHHQDDLSCRDAIDGYKDLLVRPTETSAEWPLDLLVERWGGRCMMLRAPYAPSTPSAAGPGQKPMGQRVPRAEGVR